MFTRQELLERRERMTARAVEIKAAADKELGELQGRQAQIVREANHDLGVIDGQVAMVNELLGRIGPESVAETEPEPEAIPAEAGG